MTKQFRIDIPLTSIDEDNAIGYGTPTDDNGRTAQILGVQTRFMEMDAGEVRAYCLIVVQQDETQGGVSTVVEMGGTISDKVRMMNTFINAMEKNIAHHKDLEDSDVAQ